MVSTSTRPTTNRTWPGHLEVSTVVTVPLRTLFTWSLYSTNLSLQSKISSSTMVLNLPLSGPMVTRPVTLSMPISSTVGHLFKTVPTSFRGLSMNATSTMVSVETYRIARHSFLSSITRPPVLVNPRTPLSTKILDSTARSFHYQETTHSTLVPVWSSVTIPLLTLTWSTPLPLYLPDGQGPVVSPKHQTMGFELCSPLLCLTTT